MKVNPTPAGAPRPRPGILPPTELKQAISRLQQAAPKATFAVDPLTNTATVVAGAIKVQPDKSLAPRPDGVAQTFLGQFGTLFGIQNAKEQVKLLEAQKDELGMTHARYQQMYQGLPVFGQQVVVHSKGNEVRSVIGRVTPNVADAPTPKLTPSDAAQIAQKRFRAKAEILSNALGVWTTDKGTPKVAYEVDVANRKNDRQMRYYLDADTGRVLDKWSLIEPIMDRETFDAQNGSSLPGKLVRNEQSSPVADEDVNIAHDNSGEVYRYYKELHDRDSLDGKGMKLQSTVHYGKKFNNAFWNGRSMTYGDGDGVLFAPLGRALDVHGHEMTHGVTSHTAKLQYRNQSGALNESWSDIMGELIEQRAEQAKDPNVKPDWLMGEDIFTPGKDGDGLRSIARPGTGHDKDKQPAHMKDYNPTPSDNGGVHINSGIPNKAAYEIAQKIGTEKLDAIWYRALTRGYLTPSSKFENAAAGTVLAARDLYGAGSDAEKAVAEGWTSVGLEPQGV